LSHERSDIAGAEGFHSLEGNMCGTAMRGAVALPGAMIGVGFLAAHANAQGVPQTVDIAKVDVQKVAAGYRASKVIGSSVLNDANETIGRIDDLLVTRDGKEPYAVLSIGGFLGMGTHMVVVRYDSLKFADNKIVLPGGTKDGLKMLPTFQYSKE
jgi:PRC-barrel domain